MEQSHCAIVLAGAEGRASVSESINGTGRTVIANTHIKKGEIICITESSSIACSDGGMEELKPSSCCICGYSVENDREKQVCNAALCKVCDQWSVNRHSYGDMNECSIFKCAGKCSSTLDGIDDSWIFEVPMTSLPAQLLLTLRVLMRQFHFHDDIESTGNPFDLVGEASDCDEGRVDIAEQLVMLGKIAAQRNHPAGKKIQEVLSRENVLRVLGILHRNAFKVREGVIALFPGAAMFNHSCGPNAVMTVEYVSKNDPPSFMKKGEIELIPDVKDLPYRCLRAVIRCISDIRSGEEICISYVPLGLHPKSSRQQAVLKRHDFVCDCQYCSSGQGEAVLLKQGVISMEDFNISVDPLEEMLDEAEELLHNNEMNDIEDVMFLLTQTEVGIDNLKLGRLHHLSMKRLYLLTEAKQLEKQFKEVLEHSSEWLRRLCSSDADTVRPLCDPHYRCRMLVLNAESFTECLKNQLLDCSPTNICEAKNALTNAIEYATIIYGDDYDLVKSLESQMTLQIFNHIETENTSDDDREIARNKRQKIFN